MANPDIITTVLRQAVPGFYILAAIYIGAAKPSDGGNNGAGRDDDDDERTVSLPKIFVRTIYAMLFGTVGVFGYLILNEPAYPWIPPWFTQNVWEVFVLLGVLGVGVALFIATVETQKLASPWGRVADLWRWIQTFFSN